MLPHNQQAVPGSGHSGLSNERGGRESEVPPTTELSDDIITTAAAASNYQQTLPVGIDQLEDDESELPTAGDIIIQQLDESEMEELYDGTTDEVIESKVDIETSVNIESLPDVSVATALDATDATCCLASTFIDRRPIVAVGSVDEKCRVYELKLSSDQAQFQNIAVLSDAKDSIVDVSFSFDGQYLATASYDCNVRVYSLQSQQLDGSCSSDISIKLLHTLDGPSDDVEWLTWHPRGYALAAGSKDATVWMWFASTGATMGVFSGHAAPVSCGVFADDGKFICTGSADASMIVWNPKNAERLHVLKTQGSGSSKSGEAYSSTAKFHTEPITCLVCHPTEPIVASGSEDSTIALSHIRTGKVLMVLRGHEDSVESLAYQTVGSLYNDRCYLASGSLDGKIQIWDGRQVRSTLKHIDIGIRTLSSPDSGPSQPISAHNNKLVGGVTRLAWLPNGSPILMSGATDCTIRIWDTRRASCIKILSGHKDSVLSLNLIISDPSRPETSVLLSASDDKSVKVWSLT